MRVAYLINQYPAVSHTFIRREIQALERQGIEVHRIALRGWDTELVDAQDVQERTKTRYVLRAGIAAMIGALIAAAIASPLRAVRALGLAWRMSRSSERPFPVHLAYLGEAALIAWWLRASGASHLHAHFATNPAEIAMLTHVLGGPAYSFTAHGSDIMDRPAQVGLQETVQRAKFAVAVCSFGRNQIFKWTSHRVWDRVKVVRCGLQPGYGKYAPPVGAIAARRLVCVGRLSKEKGQLLLLRAVELAVRECGEPFEVVLAGDGPMRADVEAAIAKAALAPHVRITGWLDSAGVAQEISQACALVVPSLSEGLPVVIMEAMAHGRPVIAPFLSGIPELVVDEETGWLYPASDSQALAQAMLRCISLSSEEREVMGMKALERVWSMHHIDEEARKLATLFSEEH